MVSSMEIMLKILVWWAEGCEAMLRADAYTHYLEWDDGFMGAHICQHFTLYTLKTYSILLGHCTSIFKL